MLPIRLAGIRALQAMMRCAFLCLPPKALRTVWKHQGWMLLSTSGWPRIRRPLRIRRTVSSRIGLSSTIEGRPWLTLTGYSITDDPSNPRKFVLPSGVTLGAGHFLLVWADGDVEVNADRPAGELHVNFGLARSGESIALYDPEGSLVNRIDFGEQAADVSRCWRWMAWGMTRWCSVSRRQVVRMPREGKARWIPAMDQEERPIGDRGRVLGL